MKDSLGITSSVELISGKFEGIKSLEAPPNSWANDSNNYFAVWIINLKSNGSFVIPKTFKDINRSIYLPKDTNIQVNNDIIDAHSMVELFSDQIATLKNNKGDARI